MCEIIYNEEHMNSIANKYAECVTAIQQIMQNHDLAKTISLDNYEGQAVDVLEDIFDKVKEHLELLKLCYETMQTYVLDSLEQMKQTDSDNANSMKGDG